MNWLFQLRYWKSLIFYIWDINGFVVNRLSGKIKDKKAVQEDWTEMRGQGIKNDLNYITKFLNPISAGQAPPGLQPGVSRNGEGLIMSQFDLSLIFSQKGCKY